jgi:hypothetical protein
MRFPDWGCPAKACGLAGSRLVLALLLGLTLLAGWQVSTV